MVFEIDFLRIEALFYILGNINKKLTAPQIQKMKKVPNFDANVTAIDFVIELFFIYLKYFQKII